MNRLMKTTLLALAALALACGPAMAGPRKPAALVLKVAGEVTVQRDGKQKALVKGMALQWNDRVIVGKGAGALVLFRNGKQLQIQKTMNITTEAGAMDPAQQGQQQSGSAFSGAPSDLDMYGGSAAGTRNYLGALDDIAPWALVTAPRNTRILDTHPAFAWSSSQTGATAIMVLRDENGFEIWATGTAQSQAQYPPGAPPLTHGNAYSVTLTAVVDGRTVNAETQFLVMEKERAEDIRAQVRKIETDLPGPENAFARRMILSGLYARNELYMDAIGELEQALREEPDQIMAWLELADLHHVTGNARASEYAQLKASVLAAEQDNPLDF